MLTASGYVFKKRDPVRPKLVWSLAVYGGETPGCQTPKRKIQVTSSKFIPMKQISNDNFYSERDLSTGLN